MVKESFFYLIFVPKKDFCLWHAINKRDYTTIEGQHLEERKRINHWKINLPFATSVTFEYSKTFEMNSGTITPWCQSN